MLNTEQPKPRDLDLFVTKDWIKELNKNISLIKLSLSHNDNKALTGTLRM